MEYKSGIHLHFIQAVRSGKVERVPNVDSCNRPCLMFNALKDIYDNEVVKRCCNPSTHQFEERYADMAMESEEVLFGILDEKKTRKKETYSKISDHKSRNGAEKSDQDDIKFGRITLKQLKKQSKAKKRKVTHFESVTVKQEYVDWHTDEDETDLKETISCWKSKVSKKSKGKKKCLEKSPQNPSPVKTESILIEASVAIKAEQCQSSPLHDEKSDVISAPEMGNHSLIVPCHAPERLLSTRKVISPTSQERLCQAMKGVELIEDGDLYSTGSECKGNSKLKDMTENKPFRKEQGDKKTKIETDVERMAKIRVSMRPKRTTNKNKSPSEGNRKGSDLSRSLSDFNSGTISLQKISESAIAFSQRQMNDFEHLARKLIHDLNSMKDIVEGKLQRETSSANILKYDVDEVSSVIKCAKKTEETTLKWLSMMTRDCDRFCTIMKLFEKGESTSPNKAHKHGRKITFADEVGGVLCHVKVFEDGMAPVDSQRLLGNRNKLEHFY